MKMLMKTRIAMVVVTLALSGVAGLAQAETRFAVQDAAGTTDKMVVTDSGYIGIGSSTPPVAITATGPHAGAAQFLSWFNALNANGGGGFACLHNNGTGLLPNANDRLGYYLFGTQDGATRRYGAGITAKADGPWSSTSVPAYLVFTTASAGTTTQSERLKITSSGNIGIGISAPTQKLEVAGGVRLNAGAKPACDASARGTLWFEKGGVGVADKVYACSKDTSENYLWVSLF